jgi:hypothetical protein
MNASSNSHIDGRSKEEAKRNLTMHIYIPSFAALLLLALAGSAHASDKQLLRHEQRNGEATKKM